MQFWLFFLSEIASLNKAILLPISCLFYHLLTMFCNDFQSSNCRNFVQVTLIIVQIWLIWFVSKKTLDYILKDWALSNQLISVEINFVQLLLIYTMRILSISIKSLWDWCFLNIFSIQDCKLMYQLISCSSWSTSSASWGNIIFKSWNVFTAVCFKTISMNYSRYKESIQPFS